MRQDQQGFQSIAEVACTDALEIEPGDQLVDAPGASQVRRQNTAGESHTPAVFIDAFVIDAGLLNLDGPNPGLDRSSREMTVANHQAMPLVITVMAVSPDILGDFVFDGLSQHILGSTSQDVGQNIPAAH